MLPPNADRVLGMESVPGGGSLIRYSLKQRYPGAALRWLSAPLVELGEFFEMRARRRACELLRFCYLSVAAHP